MKRGYLGALGVWLAGVGLALAQPAPEYRPAMGFYHPMAPAVYSPNGWMPQQQPRVVYSQSMVQPGYPQAYPQSYPQGYQQGYAQPMYYLQPAMYLPVMVQGQGMPVQWTAPVGTMLPSAPYTISGPTMVPNRTAPMPPAEEASPVASVPAAPPVEAAKSLPLGLGETAAPPMLPAASQPLSSAHPAISEPAIAEETDSIEGDTVEEKGHRHKKSLGLFSKKGKKKDSIEATSDENCDKCETKKGYKKKFSLGLGKKDKPAPTESYADEGDDDSREHEVRDRKGDQCEEGFCHYWFAMDYLAWMNKKGRLDTPVVTNGVTTLIGGGNDLDYDIQQGGRLRAGYRFNDCWAVESSGFYLIERSTSMTAGSDATGAPALSRPFINAADGTLLTVPVSIPGVASGTVNLESSSRLYGGDANVARTLYHNDKFVVNLLGGFRYLSLEEDLSILQNTQALDGTAVLNTRQGVEADNRFYGGQTGLSSGVQLGRVYLGTTGKFALGVTQELVRSEGGFGIAGGAGPLPALVATGSNNRTNTELAYVAESQFEVGYQISPHVNAMLGWNFLYWNKVARPGDQISDVVNRPPTQDVTTTNFWSQGLTATIGIRF